MLDVPGVVAQVRAARTAPGAPRTLLVAFSGIDAAGKGYVAHQVANALRPEGIRVAVLTPNAWLTPFDEHRRAADPVRHYYEQAVDFADLFRLLIDPLKENGSVRLTRRIEQKSGEEWTEFCFDLERVEVVVLESVFLLKREWRSRYDLSYWVECCYETALARARDRSPFGAFDEEVELDFRRIRFPAQEMHFTRDEPRQHASGVIENDSRQSLETE